MRWIRSLAWSLALLLVAAAPTTASAEGEVRPRFVTCPGTGWDVLGNQHLSACAGWQADASLDTLFDTPEGIVYQRADDDSRWLFDRSTGQVLWMSERNGWTYRYSYSGGLLVKVTNAFGRELTFSHDASGRLVMATGPDGVSVSYVHDAANRLVQVERPDGSWTRYVYEDQRFAHAVTGSFDETGSRRQTIAYDEQGRAVLSELYGGAGRTRVAYDTLRTTVTDSLGVTRSGTRPCRAWHVDCARSKRAPRRKTETRLRRRASMHMACLPAKPIFSARLPSMAGTPSAACPSA